MICTSVGRVYLVYMKTEHDDTRCVHTLEIEAGVFVKGPFGYIVSSRPA